MFGCSSNKTNTMIKLLCCGTLFSTSYDKWWNLSWKQFWRAWHEGAGHLSWGSLIPQFKRSAKLQKCVHLSHRLDDIIIPLIPVITAWPELLKFSQAVLAIFLVLFSQMCRNVLLSEVERRGWNLSAGLSVFKIKRCNQKWPTLSCFYG